MDQEAIERIAKEIQEAQDCRDEISPLGTAGEILKILEELGYRKLPQGKLPLLSVPDHSESIWCPHCGEEFGIESNIEYAHEAQREADIKFYTKPPFSAGFVDEG